VFDALQKMSDDPLTDCPDCGKPDLKKLLSAPNFRLKGSGWYETDFKKDNQRNLAGGAAAKTGQDGKDTKTGEKGDAGKDTGAKPDGGRGGTNAGGSATAKSAD
jgi:putative FmdB family regulatory protein